MNLTRQALSNPTAVVVGLILITLFGLLSLLRLPVQMTPNVERPQIIVQTNWRAAAPEEIEAEIIEPQEDVLKNVPGLIKLESEASQGRSSVTLKFDVEVDLRRALLETMNQLNRVPRYPVDADEPILYVGSDEFGGSIAWFAIQATEGNERDIRSYKEYVEDVIQTRIERIDGVSKTNIYGALEQELRITFDPAKLAAVGLTIAELANRLSGIQDSSGGFADVGRRRYTLRFKGKHEVENFSQIVVATHNQQAILLSDVAAIEYRLQDEFGVLYQIGSRGIAMNIIPENNVNVLDIMAKVKVITDELNANVLPKAGLSITKVYDESLYVTDAVELVRSNLALGIILAIAVLWWFLRKFRATLMVAVAIPLALTSTFIVFDVFGRSLNIVSLAGLAFAVGMVLDAAIVVLENIVRLREEGKSRVEAALQGAGQVWGALLSSTATTIAIFIPILFLEDVSGQLFGDLALAITVAVVSSLLVAVLVLPAGSVNLLSDVKDDDPHKKGWDQITDKVMLITSTAQKRWAWVIGLMLTAISITLLLFPQTDYLPKGNRNLIFGIVMTPPGQGVEASRVEIGEVLNERLKAYYEGEKEPHIQDYFLGLFGNFGFVGGTARDPDQIQELLHKLNTEILQGFPDTIAFASQAEIFARLDGGRSIEVDIQATNIDLALDAARAGFGKIMQVMPAAQTRPLPGLEFAEPEIRLTPNESRIVESGLQRRDVAQMTAALGDGLFLGEYFDGQRRARMILRAPEWTTPEQLVASPVYTPNSDVLPLSELVDMKRTAGPSQIRRVDRRRAITLLVTPPDNMSLEQAITLLKEDVEPVITALLPEDGTVTYRGSANALETTLKQMGGSFLLALVILYLLMAALFRSFKDSLLVVLALPLATFGGVAVLQITNLFIFQPLDLLTMIGFVILLGLVVNNAILLVHQTRVAEREGMHRRDAVKQSVRLRLRPILMSTLTSLFGMMPLLLIPGAGAELYRGIAAVIVGGMSVSTLFTLIFLPSLLRMGEEKFDRVIKHA
ncbi:efflux RND transporter permease subunit [Algibacillus agarilyticus]|uniref:efflux RND transporter permease subunit n=1 Tax=Algibacillus agarilyticus TaxID=2234133 RepID=UPI000DCFC9C6|nr:efflux RND transporter permease subunit [Algibacillus agarilyticus]